MKKRLKKWRWYKIPERKALVCYVGDKSFGFNFEGEWADYFNMSLDTTEYQNWVKVDEEEIRQRLLETTKKANKVDKILKILEHERDKA